MSELAPLNSEQPRKARWLQFTLPTMLVVVLAFACTFGIMRLAHQEAECNNNLKLILLAMHGYHSTYGCFPPAYISDANGRPRHSWRVLLLPFLDEPVLYQAYDFSEPWNGPNNSKLASRMPANYACPAGGVSAGTTSYLAVVGPETLWPGDKPVVINQIRDGLSNTIAFVEVVNSGIPWLEPRDLDFSTIAVPSNRTCTISSNHFRGPFVGFCDGSTARMPKVVTPETLKRLLTINGGEPISRDRWESLDP